MTPQTPETNVYFETRRVNNTRAQLPRLIGARGWGWGPGGYDSGGGGEAWSTHSGEQSGAFWKLIKPAPALHHSTMTVVQGGTYRGSITMATANGSNMEMKIFFRESIKTDRGVGGEEDPKQRYNKINVFEAL